MCLRGGRKNNSVEIRQQSAAAVTRALANNPGPRLSPVYIKVSGSWEMAHEPQTAS